MSGKSTGFGKMKAGLIAALALPPLLIFGFRGLPSTDRPAAADFNDSKPEGVCAYRACARPAAGLHEVRVTTGTDSTLNKTIILVSAQPHRLCAKHAGYAAKGRWPLHGWKFALALVGALVLCAFISLGLMGAGLLAAVARKSPPSSS